MIANIQRNWEYSNYWYDRRIQNVDKNESIQRIEEIKNTQTIQKIREI